MGRSLPPARACTVQDLGQPNASHEPDLEIYGVHTFDWAADWAARAKPAAMAANCVHPARMVLGPGGL